jgi:glutathione S-transferase
MRGSPRFDTSEELARAIIGTKLDGMNARLARRSYLVGETCTMADLAWFTRVDLLPGLGVPVNAARYPHIRRWFEAIAVRPSVSEGHS